MNDPQKSGRKWRSLSRSTVIVMVLCLASVLYANFGGSKNVENQPLLSRMEILGWPMNVKITTYSGKLADDKFDKYVEGCKSYSNAEITIIPAENNARVVKLVRWCDPLIGRILGNAVLGILFVAFVGGAYEWVSHRERALDES